MGGCSGLALLCYCHRCLIARRCWTRLDILFCCEPYILGRVKQIQRRAVFYATGSEGYSALLSPFSPTSTLRPWTRPSSRQMVDNTEERSS